MGKTAFAFPGQGSQHPAMIEPFVEAWPAVGETIDQVADSHLQTLLRDADEQTLRHSANTQPAVLATSVATARAICDRTPISPSVVCGHSLGHISALTAAGTLTFESALSLVAERGRLMQAADETAGPGTMVAVSLVEPAVVESAVEPFEEVAVAGYNGPSQTVISGPQAVVDKARSAIEDQVSIVRATELDVGSGFHSPVMEPAIEPMEAVVSETNLQDPTTPVVSDLTGELYTDPAVARRQLVEQLTAPIRWTAVIETLVDHGVERLIELPPAGTLSSLTERIAPELEIISVTDPTAIEEVVARERPLP